MKRLILAMLLMGFVFSLANPSAVYCEELGYEYKTVEGPDGEEGVCKLPSGQEVNAWSFFQGKVAVQYSYCTQQGYGMTTVTEDEGNWTSEYGACILSNGTAVSVSELMGLETGGMVPEEGAGNETMEEGTEEPEEEGAEEPEEEPAPAEEEPATAEEPEEEPAPEEGGFPLIPAIIAIIVVVVLAYWFMLKE
ncbi:DUF333 domain-containing protein [Candidatus Micrarchaeota archaeon]|nr:DUF333 domain-containing protein [Candidatus Micrarchaeota archaeon]